MTSAHWTLRVPKKLVFSVVACTIVLAALEIGQRISDWRKSRRPLPPDSARFETTRGEPITDRRGAIVMTLDPYLLFRPKPGQSTPGVTINAQGFRGKDWKKEKAPGTLRVAVVGASSVFGLWALSDEKTIPARLEGELAKLAPGRSFEVLNAGISAFDSLQELVLLESEVLDYEPDCVLFFDGWNDFYNAGLTPPDRALVWHRQFQDLEEVIARGDETFLNVLRCSAFFRGLERRVLEMRESRASPSGHFGVFNDHPQGVLRYRKHLELATKLALAQGAKVILVSQPEITERANPTDQERAFVESRAEPGYAAYARERYPAYVAAAHEAARACSVPHDDCAKIFDAEKETVFRDWVHFEDRGNELVARHLAPLVLDALGAR